MCINSGMYNGAVKLSDYRKLESLNVTRASGSITDCCHLIPVWFGPLNELPIREP